MELVDIIIRSATISVGLLMVVHLLSVLPVSRKTVSALLDWDMLPLGQDPLIYTK